VRFLFFRGTEVATGPKLHAPFGSIPRTQKLDGCVLVDDAERVASRDIRGRFFLFFSLFLSYNDVTAKSFGWMQWRN
jgi:hypothetical protein